MQPGSSYVVGRDPAADIPIDDPRVSWRHAILRTDDNGWLLEDQDSTNGTFAGSRRIQRAGIEGEIVFRLGDVGSGPQLACSVPLVPDSRIGVDREPTSVIRVPSRPLRIGRAPDNDVVLSDLIVSRYHAELRKRADGRHEIVDLGGHNGTFVNGKRITSAALTESDIVGIGRATFRLVGDELREFIDTGDVSLVANDLTVRTSKGKVLLDHVSFPIPERCLVGVIGPSGAGKSTLLGAVTGTRPATEGGVRYDNRDLYRHYAELRHRIGLVPQEDILHTQLPTRRALRYAAELRFPGDTVAAERDRRVDEVIEELGLTPHAQTRIDSLSGGQRKRVSVALELLTKPSLLFLDEPTSGLDPGLDKSVMEMMRDLAHDGRTIVVVTHSVANLDTCDRLLVLVPGGRVAFYGPPEEGLSFFGKASWAEVFQAFDREPDRDWAAEFRMAPLYSRYVLSGLDGDAETPGAERVTAAPPPRRQGRFAQLGTLCRRYLAVIGSDRSYLAVVAVLPLVVGLLIRAMPAPHGLTGLGENDDAASVLLTLVIGACFVGAANSVRELVKERPIYRRERAAGLSAGIYLLSKIFILGLITGVQAVLLVLIGLVFRPMPAHGAFTSPYLELMLAMAGLAIVSMVMGLLVSAAVSTSEKTMPLLVLLSLAQVILCGALMPLEGKAGLEQIAWVTPSRWGLGAAASTVDLGHLPHRPIHDRLWHPDATTWATDMGVLAGLGLVFVVIAWWRLERLRPGRRTRL
ncbi:FHA domain-containing protein [Actinoallomurus sp. NPDC050550]|uniref:FHA domain-containing protein n=1 Tax=Actinoallomurus sp. NPDC050550 TaxID=3154937 RepID=UPI0033CDDA2B